MLNASSVSSAVLRMLSALCAQTGALASKVTPSETELNILNNGFILIIPGSNFPLA